MSGGPSEMFRALGALVEAPGPAAAPVAEALGLGPLPEAAAYTDLFDFQLYPFASVYLGSEGMLGGEARDRIAGFWRALGETPPVEPDHLAVMLGLYARLGELEAAASEPAAAGRWRHARRAFLWEHLASWLPVYLDKLAALAPPAFYRGWGRLLDAALAAEIPAAGPAAGLPLHLREAPGLADPGDGGYEAFADSLLAPVRSGLVLVRSDLERAARELGLAARVGERRYVLRALLGQDPGATLRWLAAEARAAATLHERRHETLGEIARFWAGRATAAADLLARRAL